MIHLTKNKKGEFEVVTIADNGEFLTGTRQGFKRRAGAFRNMFATANQFGVAGAPITFQDDTLRIPKVFHLIRLAHGKNLVRKVDMPLEAIYIPKNASNGRK